MSNRRTLSLVAIAALALGSLACTRTFHAQVVQPNPLVKPTETLRDSEIVRIVTGDMELNLPREAEQRVSVLRHKRYPLINEASFTVVSRDRLRFHVQVDHKWIEWADLGTWEVYLVDDQGHRYLPEGIEHAHTKHMVSMWDYEIRSDPAQLLRRHRRDQRGRLAPAHAAGLAVGVPGQRRLRLLPARSVHARDAQADARGPAQRPGLRVHLELRRPLHG
ncbi:MAG: hypothetical protein IPL61_02140 [Myxococcales bacterium]|nr:hypothetical protein [Myxococcales bacterium]